VSSILDAITFAGWASFAVFVGVPYALLALWIHLTNNNDGAPKDAANLSAERQGHDNRTTGRFS